MLQGIGHGNGKGLSELRDEAGVFFGKPVKSSGKQVDDTESMSFDKETQGDEAMIGEGSYNFV